MLGPPTNIPARFRLRQSGAVRAGLALGIVASSMALGGCGMGLSSGYQGPPSTGSVAGAHVAAAQSANTIVDIHSTNCSGLELERKARLQRIAELQKDVSKELGQLPSSIAHALARASSTPETGTNAYQSIMDERALLASNASAASKIGCPPAPPAGQ